MEKIAIGEDIYWVGVIDWNLREFHGYRTSRGSTYNAYLILDKKKCLIDTVKAPFSMELVEKIKSFLPLTEIDYIVSNHLELDHAGAVAKMVSHCPKAKILATGAWIAGAKKYFGKELPVQQVHTGEQVPLGKNTLTFIEAPMLHWPDSMFTYLPEQQILLANDAFGQHYATSLRFDEEVPEQTLMEEAAKYYANILWPFSPLIAKMLAKIEELKLRVRIIAPSHGIIWRTNPSRILTAYQRWAAGETKAEAVVAYDTMWGSTERLARLITDGLSEEGVPVSLMSLKTNDHSDIILALLEAKGLVLGSPVMNHLPFPSIVDLYTYLQGLKPPGKLWAVFGSYGWNKDVLPRFAETIRTNGFNKVLPSVFQTRYRPDAEEEEKAVAFGCQVAKKIKNGGESSRN